MIYCVIQYQKTFTINHFNFRYMNIYVITVNQKLMQFVDFCLLLFFIQMPGALCIRNVNNQPHCLNDSSSYALNESESETQCDQGCYRPSLQRFNKITIIYIASLSLTYKSHNTKSNSSSPKSKAAAASSQNCHAHNLGNSTIQNDCTRRTEQNYFQKATSTYREGSSRFRINEYLNIIYDKKAVWS